MTLTVEERITKSLDILRKLEVKATTEQDKGILNRFMTSFNNMNNPKSSDINLTVLKNTYKAVKDDTAQCPSTPPAPTPTKDTKIPAVPKASKLPAKKDFTEIEGQVCKQLPTQLGSSSTTSSRDGKQIEELKQPDKPTFDWGIKFTYDPTEQNYGLTCTPNTGISLNSSERKQEWYMTLLPAMKSQMPKSPGMDTPNAMPGLQFQLKSNIAKHRIPGSQPVYQHLGIDTVMVTIVGCFTGDGGKKTRTEDITSPNQYANSMNPNISKDGNYIKGIKLTEEEQKVLDASNTIATNLGASLSAFQNGSIPRRDLVTQLAVNGFGDGTNASYVENLLKSIEKKGYTWRPGVNKFISNVPIPSQQEVETYNRSTNDPKFISSGLNTNEENKLNKGKDTNLATIKGDTLTTRNTLKNEGVNTTWMQNPNMQQCDPCIGVMMQAERLDSYHEFTSFQRLSYNRELEVEINLAKNNDGRTPQKNKYEEWGWNATSAKTQKDADWGPLRNGENGNPRFKGVIRGMEAYYARQDRTWYLMTIEVTDLGLSSDIPLNLIKELTEAAEAAVAEAAESADPTKDLEDKNARLDCILQQGNGMFTEPDDVWGTTNRAYIAGNAFGGGELIAWDMYTGEGIKYKIEKTTQDGKEIRYAKASSEVLTPQEVGQILADTDVNLISAASGGVARIRVDTDVRKQFFLTMYERGAIDYKPSGIGEDVLQSEVVGNISSESNQNAEKALQLLCKSVYSTSRKFDAGEKVDAGAQQYANTNRTLTTLTLPELAIKANELGGNTTEAELGVLINAWTSEGTYTEDHGLKIFQDLRMIKEGTCKGFGLAIANMPGAKWQLITPYGLFKQVLDSPNANTEGDLSFLLKYIDIKTNPYQSGYVAFADGSGSKNPSLKNSAQKIACFSEMRSGDMDPNTPGVQSIQDVNEGQYNQYDPLAAGDSIPLDGLNSIEAFLGTVSTLIACGIDFLPAVGSFLVGLAAAPFTAGTSAVAGVAFSGLLAVLAAAACADSFGNLTAAAAGKREYDWLGGLIDIATAFIPEIVGRKAVRESAKRIAKALGVKGVIESIGKTILDLFAQNSSLRKLSPVDSVKAIWENIVKNAATSSGIPSSDPIIIATSNPNFFQKVWNWILRATGKTVSTLFDLLVKYDNNPNLTNIRNVIKGNKTDAAFLANLDTHVPPKPPKDLKAGDVVVTRNGEIFIVKELMTDGTNYKGITLLDLSNSPNGTEYGILPTHPIHDYLYKADDLLAKESDIISLPLSSASGTASGTTSVPPATVPGVARPPVLSTNEVDLVITKLRGSDPDIITELTNVGINPISRTSIVGDTVVKIGDNDTYVVVDIDRTTGTIKVKNLRTGAITVADNTYYNVNDLNKITLLPSIPAFSPIVMGPPLPTVTSPPASSTTGSGVVPPPSSVGIPPSTTGTTTVASTAPIFVPTINTKTGTVINKLQTNNPDIVTILAAEGINPIGLHARVGDSLVKVGDSDTYTVVYADLTTSTFKVKNNRTGIEEDLDNTFFAINDIKKVEVKNNPAFTFSISDLENSKEYAPIQSYMTRNADIALQTAKVPFLQANPVVNVGELIVNRYGEIYEVTEIIPGTNSVKIRKSDGSELTIVPSLSTQFYKADDILAKKLDIENEINKSTIPATSPIPTAVPKPLTVVYGDSNNYINSVVDNLITTNKIPEPSSEDIYYSYYDAWYNEVKDSTLNRNIKDLMEPVQINTISSMGPNRISNILTGQFIDKRGEILVYHSIDNINNVIYFTKISNNTVEAIPFSSTEELFNISTPLGPTLTHYLKKSISKPI